MGSHDGGPKFESWFIVHCGRIGNFSNIVLNFVLYGIGWYDVVRTTLVHAVIL